jgi:hypothetical protein
MSPYVYCSNNPINRVDPDGNTDYFSNTGQFITSRGSGHDIRIGNKLFSEYCSMYFSSNSTASKVVSFYAKQLGYSGAFGAKYIDNANTVASTNPKSGDVNVNMTQVKAGSLDNFNDLKSTLSHEGDPKWGHKSELKRLNDKEKPYTYSEHSQVYYNEVQTSVFENSSDQNQQSVTYEYANYLYNAFNHGEITQDEVANATNQFNKNTSGSYEVNIDFSNPNGAIINIQQNGTTQKYGTIPLSDPR